MPNKTIYVSEKDTGLFDQAKEIAGEALSSVIVRALREFVARSTEKEKGMQEISVKIGAADSQRVQKFSGERIGEWKGFSDNKKWFQKAELYYTQKGNWAVLLETVCSASLLTNKFEWKKSGDYLLNPRRTELIVGKNPEEIQKKIPASLFEKLLDLAQKYENPIEYLDI